MRIWRDLSEEEWRAHPLNRVRDWMALIVCLYAAIAIFAVVALYRWGWYCYTTFEYGSLWALASIFISNPVGAFLLAGLAEALIVLIIIYTRLRGAPFVISFLVAARWLWWIWLDLSAESFFQLAASNIQLTVAILIFYSGMIIYLFLGARPNVMFRRRVRIPS